jgi:hypothetical protein
MTTSLKFHAIFRMFIIDDFPQNTIYWGKCSEPLRLKMIHAVPADRVTPETVLPSIVKRRDKYEKNT